MSDLSLFKAFLVEAKKNSYNGRNKKVQSSKPTQMILLLRNTIIMTEIAT